MNTLILWLVLLPLTVCGSSRDTVPPGVQLYWGPSITLPGQTAYSLHSAPGFQIAKAAPQARYTVLRWQWGLGVLASLVAGGAWGIHEKTMHHWWEFSDRFPNANPEFWNPAISWRNKYVDGDPAKGRTDVPVVFTDAKHLLASTALAGGFVAGASFTLGEEHPWWYYPADFLAGAFAWWLGNRITFNWLYR